MPWVSFSLSPVSSRTAHAKGGRVQSSCLIFRTLGCRFFRPPLPALTSGESTHARNFTRNSRIINTSNLLNLKLLRINTYKIGGRGARLRRVHQDLLPVSLTARSSYRMVVRKALGVRQHEKGRRKP
jgi:hypothetical protein